MSFSVKLPFCSRIVMLSNLWIFAALIGHPANVFSKYVRSLCLRDAGKLMMRCKPNSHSSCVPHLNTGQMYWFWTLKRNKLNYFSMPISRLRCSRISFVWRWAVHPFFECGLRFFDAWPVASTTQKCASQRSQIVFPPFLVLDGNWTELFV